MIDRVMGWKKQDVKIHLDGLVGSFKDSRTSHTKLTGKRLCFSSVIYSFLYKVSYQFISHLSCHRLQHNHPIF